MMSTCRIAHPPIAGIMLIAIHPENRRRVSHLERMASIIATQTTRCKADRRAFNSIDGRSNLDPKEDLLWLNRLSLIVWKIISAKLP